MWYHSNVLSHLCTLAKLQVIKKSPLKGCCTHLAHKHSLFSLQDEHSRTGRVLCLEILLATLRLGASATLHLSGTALVYGSLA